MIQFQTHPEGVVLPLRAHAAARRNALDGQRDGALRVSVTQAAEKGKANKAIVALLCDRLALRRSQVELVAGETSTRKLLLVRGVAVEELRRRIDEALGR